jgi:hypothetical protein
MTLPQAVARGADALRAARCYTEAEEKANLEAARLLEHLVATNCPECGRPAPCDPHQVKLVKSWIGDNEG